MNVAILSSTACYHHLAQLLEKESNTIYHYGCSKLVQPRDNYTPIYDWFPLESSWEKQINNFLNDINYRNIDLVLASGLSAPLSGKLHFELAERKIPYLFVNQKVSDLERDKSLTKQLLTKLSIPSPKSQKTDGKYLYENFRNIPRPFVIKLNYIYQYGKQTIIVKDDNYEEVFEDLFSTYTTGDYRITNIEKKTSLLIEEYVELKSEFSYHALFNKNNWQYLGSGRDYKRLYEGERGPNSVSMGCYSIVDVDPRVHEYAEKIYDFLKKYLGEDYYKGFIFLGIGVDQNDVPMILEINTRSGDPELATILGTVKNNLTELFYATATDARIPKVKHNKQESVSIRVVNRIYDWTTPASFIPRLENIPEDITVGFDSGPTNPEGTELKMLKHSLLTTTAKTKELAAKRLYEYLDKQYIGQYTYRRDIGLLK